jgi:hypothetical protein
MFEPNKMLEHAPMLVSMCCHAALEWADRRKTKHLTCKRFDDQYKNRIGDKGRGCFMHGIC